MPRQVLRPPGHFCAELNQQAPQVEQLDVDDCLKQMQDPQEPGGFFSGWLRDYRTVAEVAVMVLGALALRGRM